MGISSDSLENDQGDGNIFPNPSATGILKYKLYSIILISYNLYGTYTPISYES